MTEYCVEQRTPEWFRLRNNVVLTASQFADALGIGRGKQYDYLKYLLEKDENDDKDDDNPHMQHGIALEPVINEAYQLLTGNTALPSGFWVPERTDFLHGVIGASPDGKVIPKAQVCVSGIVEYKAPVYSMYDAERFPHGIPRRYMVQMQGQMGVSKLPWCDFMAVCMKTKEIRLKRVHFQPAFWMYISTQLGEFAEILQEARERKKKGEHMLNFDNAESLKKTPQREIFFPGERGIYVEDLLTVDARGRFKSTSGSWFMFDFLMGVTLELPVSLNCYKARLLQLADKQIKTDKESTNSRS